MEASNAHVERTRECLATALGRAGEELGDALVLTDLVAESFALVEVVIQLQESLGIRLMQEDLREVATVGDLVRVCASRLAESGADQSRP
ncbi:MAG: acyl carrier protein [Gammaproteobacteria bacterium]|nr:acyl carrier protein [Gammaproteobacteria bacterium]